MRISKGRARSGHRQNVALTLGVACALAVTGCAGEPEPLDSEQKVNLAVEGNTQRVWCAGPAIAGGSTSAPAVVLVSGIGDDATSAQWSKVKRRLVGGVRVCRYDRPGTGESPDPVRPGRGADALDLELAAVVDHASPDSPVLLAAHSFGAYPVLIYTARHPHRVAGVVLVDALDPGVGVAQGTGAASVQAVTMGREQLDLADVERAAQSVRRLPGDPPLTVLTRGDATTPAWLAGQERLAQLSARSRRQSVRGSGHQMPYDEPDVIAAAVDALLTRRPMTQAAD